MSSCSTLLNDDILREILSHSPRPTCMNLMRTCKFLYREGAKAALRHPVILTHHMEMFKFIHFLYCAEDGHRFRDVRDLRICFITTDFVGLAELSEAIRLMTGLEALHFDVNLRKKQYAEIMLSSFLPLVDAISRLPHLRRISIKGAGPSAKELMRRIHSDSLEVVLLSWDFGRPWNRGPVPAFVEPGDDWPSLHPIPFLSKWTATLQELTCGYWYNAPVLPAFPHVYPHMRRLTIRKANAHLRLAPFIRAYPNLEFLDVYLFDGVPPEPDEDRAVNVDSQHAAGGPGPWRHLQEVVGPMEDLYALGLQAPIGLLRIVDGVSNFSLDYFSTVFQDVQPRGIKFDADGALFLPEFLELLRGAGASRLESIDISIELRDQADKDFSPVLDDLASALARLPLRQLHLRLLAYHLQPPPPTPLLNGERHIDLHTPLTPAERSLDDYDLNAFVRGLANTVASLTEAVVEIDDLRQRRSGLRQSTKRGEYRRVAGSDQSRQAVGFESF